MSFASSLIFAGILFVLSPIGMLNFRAFLENEDLAIIDLLASMNIQQRQTLRALVISGLLFIAVGVALLSAG